MEQDIYKEPYYPVEVISLDENLLTPDYFDLCFDNSNSTTLGISALYGKKSELSHLAIATDSLVLLIRLVTNRSLTHKRHERRVLEDKVLCNPDFEKLAFDAERLATALFLDCGYCINNLVDIQSLLPMKPNRGSTAALQVSLGGQHRLNMKGVMCAFRQSHKEESLRNRALVLRAWSSYSRCHSSSNGRRVTCGTYH
ncbi:hypothetical protein QCA50_006017 [Cerrena zonata]|uniref:Uncharacterized protein n=1 Tax=Cerrena zonata TaxID=2478898 RepID=A0AAW0GGR3_9APHY